MDKKFQWRISWSAGSNCTFKGESDWMEWEGFEESIEEVEKEISRGNRDICCGLETALEQSGFEWSAEVREAE